MPTDLEFVERKFWVAPLAQSLHYFPGLKKISKSTMSVAMNSFKVKIESRYKLF